MLQLIRDRATGWLAWTIIILICIPFALWGINEYIEPRQEQAVARVNDTEIGYNQYRNAFQQQRLRLQEMFGGSLPASLLDDGRLRQQTLDALINDEVLVQQSVDSGMRVGDAQLAQAIRTLPAFQRDGSFSQGAYEGFLRARGTSAEGFEFDLRRSMLSEQVITALRRSAIVTEREVEQAMRILGEQRHFRALRIDPAAVQVAEPTEQEIQAWFESHPEQYVQPEQVKVRYIELTRAAAAQSVAADEAELRAIYEQRQASYRTAEQRETRHILLDMPPDASQQQTEAVRVQIEQLRERIIAGEDFAEVAKAHSQDPGSALAGGALGTVGRGMMDPAFEEAAFALEQGELSEPVRSRFGWHLIEVTGVQAEQVGSFEEVRADVLDEYRRAQADQVFADQVERLANLSFEHPESLEVAAQALAVEPLSSEFFSRSGNGASGMAADPKVRSAAFSDEVLNAGNNSALVELDTDRVLVLRLEERAAARARSLDEVRDEIRATLHREAAAAAAVALGERLLAALRAGTAMEEAARVEGLVWSDERTATRQDPGELDADAASALFKLPPPQGAPASFTGSRVAAGGYSVLALLSVNQVELAPDEQREQRERVATTLESGLGEQGFAAVMRALRKRAEVEVLERNLRGEDG
jgi:peptidyl-prolyl cis-trans isomerase D